MLNQIDTDIDHRVGLELLSEGLSRLRSAISALDEEGIRTQNPSAFDDLVLARGFIDSAAEKISARAIPEGIPVAKLCIGPEDLIALLKGLKELNDERKASGLPPPTPTQLLRYIDYPRSTLYKRMPEYEQKGWILRDPEGRLSLNPQLADVNFIPNLNLGRATDSHPEEESADESITES